MLRTARFALVVHHDDDVREYAYDGPQILNAAAADGWTVLSMRDDFARLWPEIPRRWRSVTGGPVLLELRSFQQAAWSVLRSVLGFLALCLTLPASSSSCSWLPSPRALPRDTHDHSSSPPDTPQSGGCHLPRWIQRKPGGRAGSVPPRECREPGHQDHADERGDQPAGFEQPCSPSVAANSRIPLAGSWPARLPSCASARPRTLGNRVHLPDGHLTRRPAPRASRGPDLPVMRALAYAWVAEGIH